MAFDGGTSFAQAPYPGTTGCDQLGFNPSLFVQPTTQQTDSASGSDVDLEVPQETSPTVPSGSEIRAQSVTLPPGFTLTPNASDGKTACTDAEANLGSLEAAKCPEDSKVGTLSIHTSVLPGTLPGFVYLGEPKPGDRYRLILTADGFGVHVKLLGSVVPDPETGQVTISFPSLPQFPFERFDLHFFGSERGLLATPTQCGTYPVNTTFTPWDTSLPKQHSTQFFILNSGPNGEPCPPSVRPFHPQFEAGVEDATAGAHSHFALNVIRRDGDQELRRLEVVTPPGFSASVAGIPYCSEAEIATASDPGYFGLTQQMAPSCPAASQIGIATTGTGAGTHPVYFPGKVYLAGPYKNAPLSLVVITPALSGPYDLGSVVVRAALHVDPTDAHITAVSDPLPQIVQGIPLRLRSIQVNLDRPEFTINPTNCDPSAVSARVFGDQGTEADPSTHFQAASCTNLGFAPKLSLRISGGTKRRANPALKAILTTRPGDANIARTSVTLPSSEILDNAHIKTVCTRVQFAADSCPAGSLMGFAKAETPLLSKPLEGPVYLRSNPEHKLPDLVAALSGQIDIVLAGRIDSVHRSLRTTFETVPDAPVSRFELSLQGGKQGLLSNTEDLCKTAHSATVKMAGQNGLAATQTTQLKTQCGGKAKRKATRAAGAGAVG